MIRPQRMISVAEVIQLVQAKVITDHEARGMLFYEPAGTPPMSASEASRCQATAAAAHTYIQANQQQAKVVVEDEARRMLSFWSTRCPEGPTNILPDEEVETPSPENKKRRSPTGGFLRPSSDPALVRQCLDMCAAGNTNQEVSDAVHLHPATVQRIRTRSVYVQHLWPTIDAWRARNPRANLGVPPGAMRRKQG